MSTKGILATVLVVGLVGVGVWLAVTSPEEGPAADSSQSVDVGSLITKAQNVEGMHYDLKVNSPKQEQKFEAEVWQTLDPKNLRIEGSFKEQAGIMIDKEEETLLYLTEDDMAMKIDKSQARQATQNSAQAQTNDLQDNLEKIEVEGIETFDGKECMVVLYPVKEGKVRVWLWKKHGVPLKSISPTEDGEAVAELYNMEVGPIEESKFSLPEGVEVQDIPTGVENLEGMNKEDLPEDVQDQIPEDMPEDIPSL